MTTITLLWKKIANLNSNKSRLLCLISNYNIPMEPPFICTFEWCIWISNFSTIQKVDFADAGIFGSFFADGVLKTIRKYEIYIKKLQ